MLFYLTLLALILLTPVIWKLGRIIIFLISMERYLSSKYVSLPGYPIVKNLFEFTDFKNVLNNCVNISRKYGSVVKVSLFYGFASLLITDLKLLEFILSTTHILNKPIGYTFLHRWLGTGLLTSDATKWKKTRKILTPAFHFKILEHYATTFHSAGDILIKMLRNESGKESFDVYPYITLCTLDIICESAMGTKVYAQQKSNSEYVSAVREMCKIIMDRSINPLKIFDFLYKFSADYKRELRCLNVLHGYTRAVIKAKRKELSENKSEPTNRKSIAFLDLVLQAEIDGRPMTDDEIQQEVDTFMFEGHDTTASGISFTLYCLSVNPEVQIKVVEELEVIFGKAKERHPTFKQLNEMKYLEMVIKESLRLYPSVPFYGRSPSHDVKYYGGVLPRYSQLSVFAYGVHRDPNIYPEPEKFDPERFLPENQGQRHPFSYLAFSAGARNCIGQKFAMLEMKNIISHILRHYVIKPVPNYTPEVVPLTVLKSLNGILIKLEERV